MLRKIDRFLGQMVLDRKKSGKSDFFTKNIRKLSVAVVAVIVFAMVFKGLMQIPQINENKRRISELNAGIEYEKTRQREIEELKDKVDTDEYIEKIASDKLGLVKNNAKIFVDVSE